VLIIRGKNMSTSTTAYEEYMASPGRARLRITWPLLNRRRCNPWAPVCLDCDKVRYTHARKYWILCPCQLPNTHVHYLFYFLGF